jgi:hypothetical protein
MAIEAPELDVPEPRRSVIQWLLDSDPSIRWQVMRDLMDMSDEFVAAERSRVASEASPEGDWRLPELACSVALPVRRRPNNRLQQTALRRR